MQRNEFLKALGRALRPLKREERQRYLANYAELLDDKQEAGIDEETAVGELGDPAAIAQPILADAKEQGLLRPKRSAMSVFLLALGSPLWLALLIAAFAVLLSLYAVAWALVITACAAELTLSVMLPAAVVFFVTNMTKNLPLCLFALGAGLVCAAAALMLWKPLAALIRRFASASARWVRRRITDLKTKGSAILS